MKFRFYITDLYEGQIVGTNDAEKAASMAASPDNFVVDTEAGEWISIGERLPVEELPE